MKLSVLGALTALLALTIPANSSDAWRLEEAVTSPAWLRISGDFRVRTSTLDNQYRANGSGSDQAVATRLLLRSEIDFHNLTAGAELQDSRHHAYDSGSTLNTDMVNTWEPLQAYLRWNAPPIANTTHANITIGRQTLDLGSRRLVARNRFRNTINSFNGIKTQWRSHTDQSVTAFYFLPLQAQPVDRNALEEQSPRFDHERFDYQFFGLFYETPLPAANAQAEFFLLGLDEDDNPNRPSRNRRLMTPGLRFHRPPQPKHWDFQIESVLQFGESRDSSLSTDTADRNHSAFFQHITLGYTLGTTWSPRLAFQYDFATGDKDPTDGNQGRFDKLFGARRFDYGPTGIYGTLTRSNISSPGYRLNLQPQENVTVMAAHRFNWLAAAKDAWPTSGLRDETGRAGRFLGHQIELRLRWEIVPKGLRLETGAAHLFAGRFIRRAPNRTTQGDATYAYIQALWSF